MPCRPPSSQQAACGFPSEIPTVPVEMRPACPESGAIFSGPFRSAFAGCGDVPPVLLDLRGEDIKQELAKTGQVVRRRAKEAGEAVADAGSKHGPYYVLLFKVKCSWRAKLFE